VEGQPESGRIYWKTPIDESDVEDKQALKLYRRKRAEWLDWLHGDDDHAICRQIWLMSWSYVIYRIINESRRIASARGHRSAALNGLIAEFNDLGFVTAQALAVRRLTEQEYRDPAKQVISLRRLVDDLKKHRRLFTREIFVGFDGAPFDPERGRTRWWERLWEQRTKRSEEEGDVGCWGEVYSTSGPDAWMHAEHCHEAFDRLLAPPPAAPKRDCVPTEIFDTLSDLLKGRAIEKARELCNKRIAHAADAVSRGKARQQVLGISFNDIDAAHHAILTVTQFVSAYLLDDTTIEAIPTPQFDQFEHLEAGWLDENSVQELSQLWDNIVKERAGWVDRAADTIINNASEQASPKC
jgi:hypothetical protein